MRNGCLGPQIQSECPTHAPEVADTLVLCDTVTYKSQHNQVTKNRKKKKKIHNVLSKFSVLHWTAFRTILDVPGLEELRN